jgi:hypothetical protein
MANWNSKPRTWTGEVGAMTVRRRERARLLLAQGLTRAEVAKILHRSVSRVGEYAREPGPR